MADEPNDELISLEDLVRETAPEGQPAPSSDVSVSPTSAAALALNAEPELSVAPPLAADPVGIVSGSAMKLDDLDSLLATEDPKFSESLAELKKQGEEAKVEAVEIDSIDLEKITAETNSSLMRVLGRALLFPLILGLKKIGRKKLADKVAKLPDILVTKGGELTALALQTFKSWIAAGFEWLKKALKTFKQAPRRTKLAVIFALLLGVMAAAAVRFAMSGHLSLGLGPNFLRSFADVADAHWEYDPKAPMEEFTDPLYHPEHVVTMDRLVVNLKSRDPEGNPMGLFEFYLEASNQVTAVELKDRENEVRDLMSRSIEQLDYDDLATVAGKEKMKVVLRKNLNLFLTRGQVRRVFLKTIVLKP